MFWIRTWKPPQCRRSTRVVDGAKIQLHSTHRHRRTHRWEQHTNCENYRDDHRDGQDARYCLRHTYSSPHPHPPTEGWCLSPRSSIRHAPGPSPLKNSWMSRTKTTVRKTHCNLQASAATLASFVNIPRSQEDALMLENAF